MTSPAVPIRVRCPRCGNEYEDWHRPSLNLDLDPWIDEAYVREASSATGPVCGHRVELATLVVEGIRAIATPIFQGGELTAAMALVGTIASLPDDPRSGPAARLRAAADALSAELGSRSDERSTA